VTYAVLKFEPSGVGTVRHASFEHGLMIAVGGRHLA